jgi:hypothetical protein
MTSSRSRRDCDDIGDVHEPATLLDYYFGHGRRQLMLSFDGGTVAGWLETHWEGSHRRWWLELDD